MKIETNKNLIKDKKAKCLSYNVKELPFLLKQEDYKNMMQLSNKNNKCNVRICASKKNKLRESCRKDVSQSSNLL